MSLNDERLKCVQHLPSPIPHTHRTHRSAHRHRLALRRRFNIEYNWMSGKRATHVTMTCNLEFIFVYSMPVHLSYKYFKRIHFHVAVAKGNASRVVRHQESATWWCNATQYARNQNIVWVRGCVGMCWYANSSIIIIFLLRFAFASDSTLPRPRSHSIRRRRFYRHFLKMHIFCVHAYHSNHFAVHNILPPGTAGWRVWPEEVQRAHFSVNIRMHSTNSKPSNEWKFHCECEHSFVYAEFNEKYCVFVFGAHNQSGSRMNVCWHVSERIIKIIDISTQLFEIQQKRKTETTTTKKKNISCKNKHKTNTAHD